MKDSGWRGLLAVVAAVLGAYLGELLVPLGVLFGVMIADYISGMARAWVTRTLSSRIGIRGIVKKLCCLFAVAVGVVVDWVLQEALARAGLETVGTYFVGLLVTVWLILNECISVLENVAGLGAPVPPFLLRLIERLKQNAGDRAEGK